MKSTLGDCRDVVLEMYNEFRTSSQLRSTIFSVILNMMLTLAIWIGVYGMEKNSKMGEMYFLGSTATHTTGNQFFDGLINGFGTIMVLGTVSFIMLGFALFDFQRVVKAWLTTSCLLILYGVSGYTTYDFCERYFDLSTAFGSNLTVLLVLSVSLTYGSFGVLAFFKHSSIRLHQFYVIANCSLIAVFYLRVFPGYTAWFVLWTVVLWDFFAVLAPMGPLKKVQEKAQDYSNNVLKLLMFSAEDKRHNAGCDKIKTGVKELIEMYSKNEAQDRDFVEKILQRRKAINPDSEQSPLISPQDDENDEDTTTCEERELTEEEKELVRLFGDKVEFDQNRPCVSKKSPIKENYGGMRPRFVDERKPGSIPNMFEELMDFAENTEDDEDEEEEEEEEELAKELLSSMIKSIEELYEENEKEEAAKKAMVREIVEEEEEEEDDDDVDIENFLSSETDVEIPVSDIRAETEITTQVSEFPSETNSVAESDFEEVADAEYTAADALNDGESVRLGFGDFVFYSLLIGQAATGGSVISTFAAGLGVVLGLIATLTVLSSEEHTTPALPMSVILGTFCYFYSQGISMIWEYVMMANDSYYEYEL